MYILVWVKPEQMDGLNTVQRVAGRTKRAVMDYVATDASFANCLAWRLHDGSGWCDGTEDGWKWIVAPNGPGVIIL